MGLLTSARTREELKRESIRTCNEAKRNKRKRPGLLLLPAAPLLRPNESPIRREVSECILDVFSCRIESVKVRTV